MIPDFLLLNDNPTCKIPMKNIREAKVERDFAKFAQDLNKKMKSHDNIWLVVSTHLKNISQNGNLPQIGMKIKNI